MWGYNDEIKTVRMATIRPRAAERSHLKKASPSIRLMPARSPYNPNAPRRSHSVTGKIGVQAKIVTYEWGERPARAKDGIPDGDDGQSHNAIRITSFATLFSCDAAPAAQPFKMVLRRLKT